MSEPSEDDVQAKAKRTFLAKNRDDRAWDEGFARRAEREGHPVICLSEAEREEYLAQARHELRKQPA